MEFITKRIEDVILSMKTGRTPTTKEPLYFDGNIPFVTPGDLKGQMNVVSAARTVSDLAIIENQAFLYNKDTILLTTIGEIAKVGIVKESVASNQQITGITVREDKILPHFFYYWIYYNKELLNFKANRAVISILNNKSLKNISIKYPKSLEFQRKIVEQLNMIQELIDVRIEMLKILDKLTKSIYHRMFGDIINNQKEFATKKLGKLTNKPVTRGIENPGINVAEGVEIIKTSDISNGRIDIKKISRTTENISQKFTRSICQEGDIIMTIRATVGESAKITKKYNGVNITRGIALISPNIKYVLPDYLLCTFLTNSFKFILDKKVRGVTFKQINLNVLKEINIPLPDIKTQEEFVKFKIHIDELRNLYEESLKIFKILFQSVLQSAFKEDVKIDEEPIFKELIKKFTIDDLKGNKKRLQYLVDLFDSKKFDSLDDYSNAKEKLFQLIEQDKITQQLTDNSLKLQVK